jgi:nucleoside 2-deoxyribosyltransferase
VNVYLAARYSRRLELCGYAAELESAGHRVTSRWLLGNHQAENEQLHRGAEAERFAAEDLADVRAAALVVAFTEAPRTSNSRGGRHVEFGYALGIGIAVVIVGPRENVFGCLVPQFESWRDFTARSTALTGERDALAV